MTSIATVRGSIPASELGMTLMHEHVFSNMVREYRQFGLLNDFSLMREELRTFREAGGSTVLDVSSAEMTRGAAPDPAGSLQPGSPFSDDSPGSRTPANVRALQQMSAETDLNIVLGVGVYRDPYLDADWLNRAGADALAEIIVRDLIEGIPGTGVRGAIIGEIGTDQWYLSALEERAFRAAGRAQMRTNAAISTHAARWPVGIAQLELLVAEGVDPRRVIIGHCDIVNLPEYHETLAQQGAFVQFDCIRPATEYDITLRVALVLNMVHKGFIDQVLLSHDVFTRTDLHIHGGGGYDYIPRVFIAKLIEAGLNQGEVDRMLIDNPRRALTGEG